jgi:hypothetical protein
LRYAFVDPLAQADRQLFPPVRTLGDLNRRLDELSTFPASAFSAAYGNIIPGETRLLADGIVSFGFSLGGRQGSAYSYRVGDEAAPCAVLFIPGSGINQSYPTATGQGTYGPLVPPLAERCVVHVLIKPNEDVRAIHDGVHKLDPSFVFARPIQYGSSYSVAYLVEALAVAKRLRQRYPTLGIVGLSQGGEAALLVSLQTEPEFAVVAAGITLVQRRVSWSNPDQIIFSGYYRDYTAAVMGRIMGRQKTSYLFSYGRGDIGDFKVETMTGETCDWVNGIAPGRTRCLFHDGGHEFMIPETLGLVEKAVAAMPTGRRLKLK